MEIDHTRLANCLLKTVLAAGAAILQHRRSGFAVREKADSSPVTAADQDAEHIILEALAKCAPGVPVVAEEAASRGQMPTLSDTFFLVDPLDGTKEFVAGGTDFTVNIALVTGRVPRFGLIYAPALSQLTMTLGQKHAVEARIGAQERPDSLSNLSVVTIRTREPDPQRLVAVITRSHRTAGTERFIADPRVASWRTIGSSLKFWLVARGEADIYPRFGETSEWDTAAGHAIVIAAGGAVTTMADGSLEYGKTHTGFVNPPFVAWGRDTIIPLIRPAIGASATLS
jgi:3'(2'), 5'-bisphosphate nucleotidase